TPKTGTLRNASAAKRIGRGTAERHLADLLKRVQAVNADESLLFYVSRVVLFGSILSDAPTVGDVDVAVELRARTDDRAQFRTWAEDRIRLAYEEDRRFRNISDEATWPAQEVMRRVKGRSPVISLTTTEDRVLEAAKNEVVF